MNDYATTHGLQDLMKSSGLSVQMTMWPVLQLIVEGPSEYGTYIVTAGITGLPFSAMVLLMPEAMRVIMNKEEVDQLQKLSSIPVRVTCRDLGVK